MPHPTLADLILNTTDALPYGESRPTIPQARSILVIDVAATARRGLGSQVRRGFEGAALTLSEPPEP